MANSIVYDSTTQSQHGANSTIAQGGFQAFSFSTGASGGSLADVQVELFELSQDSGSITAYLYSNTAASNTLGSQLAALGTVSDASLSSGPGSSGLTLADFGGNMGTVLAPNTRYWIKLVSTSNSNVNVEFASGSGGTGVSTEYQETQASVAGTSDSNATSGVSVQARVTEAVCFAAGTRVLTSRGEVPVEQLVVDDLVVTSPNNVVRPVRWLGHRLLDCRRHPRPADVMPVRIAAHAFADNRPSRDLLVSPGHAICVDAVGEILIPASALINGTTIVQDDVEAVTYWHVELDDHNVLLAENMPCESYLEMGNRSFFNESAATTLHASPDARTLTHANFCRPFHQAGPVLKFVRERLAARANDLGWTLRDGSLADLHLVVDGRRVEPEVHGLQARFLLPAAAEDVWLVSGTSVPAEIGPSSDRRALGVCIGSLVIHDGFDTPHRIDSDDMLLDAGFHPVEDGPQRWTCGRARLPAALWEDCHSDFFLRVELTRPALPRWVAPEHSKPVVPMSRRA